MVDLNLKILCLAELRERNQEKFNGKMKNLTECKLIFLNISKISTCFA